jgi:hypothetical protein
MCITSSDGNEPGTSRVTAEWANHYTTMPHFHYLTIIKAQKATILKIKVSKTKLICM